MRAPFISFEGGDGVGKTTQIQRLAARLQQEGHRVLLTREPGGAPGAEKLRTLLVTGEADAYTPLSEALMMYAARAEHLAKTINPARVRGEVVISDRFSDSTMAYQGLAGDVGEKAVSTLESLVVGADGPDLTIILHLAAKRGLARTQDRQAQAQSDETRFERKGDEFHQRVEQAFLTIADQAPERCKVIDAGQSMDAVEEEIYVLVRPVIENWVSASKDALSERRPTHGA